MIDEKLGELFPLVARLTEKYTSGESTSVTYETANKLMGAIIYSINEYEHGNQKSLAEYKIVTTNDKYLIGKELLIRKINDTRALYNGLISNFEAYENENYYDTVVKALPGFFQYYDHVFEPQNTIITCDYPTVISVLTCGETGIDLISIYLKYIEIEQAFLSKMPKEIICELLYDFDHNYKKQFYNISTVILHHMLGCIMIGKNVMEMDRDQDYNKLFEMINELKIDQLEIKFKKILRKLIDEIYNGSEEMYQYYSNDIMDFAIRLKSVRDPRNLRNVVKL